MLLQVPIDPHDSITEDERERDLIGQWCFMATSPPVQLHRSHRSDTLVYVTGKSLPIRVPSVS